MPFERLFGAVIRTCSVLLLLLLPPAAAGESAAIVKSNPRTFEVTARLDVFFDRGGGYLSRMTASMPMPPGNQYQDVTRIGFTDGALERYEENDGRYLYFDLFDRRKSRVVKKPFTAVNKLQVTLYSIQVDFAALENNINPYLEMSPLYRMYTKSQGDYIKPSLMGIAKPARTMKSKTSNPVALARRTLEYIRETYAYEADRTTLSPLEEVIDRRQGGEGDLVSVFVSLMRAMGIPARHLVALSPGGQRFVMADFYLEHHGWVPVDVAGYVYDPENNLFGTHNAGTDLLIMSVGVGLTVKSLSGTETRDLFDTFRHHYTVVPSGLTYKMRNALFNERNPRREFSITFTPAP